MKRNVVNIPNCDQCTNRGGVLCNLSLDGKIELSEQKGSNYYKKGQTIFYEGNHAGNLYCIHRGRVKLSKLGDDGKEQIVRFAKPGDILGYRAMLSNEPYHATATAMEDCYICLIQKSRFNDLLGRNTKLSSDVIQLLSKDLKLAEQLLIDITQKSAKERIAESLILLEKTFGFQEDGKTLAVTLTRSEIADMAATTTETTIRTLSQLSEEGFIDLVGKRIIFKDNKGLERLAGLNF